MKTIIITGGQLLLRQTRVIVLDIDATNEGEMTIHKSGLAMHAAQPQKIKGLIT